MAVLGTSRTVLGQKGKSWGLQGVLKSGWRPEDNTAQSHPTLGNRGYHPFSTEDTTCFKEKMDSEIIPLWQFPSQVQGWLLSLIGAGRSC